jgi:hypothetical protein
MRMLSVNISSWHIHSVHASVPYAHSQHALKGPCQIRNFYAFAEHTRKVTDAYAQGMYPFLTLYAQDTHQFLTHMLRVRISSWPVCSGYVSVPDTYAQGTHQFLTSMLKVRISSWRVCAVNAPVPDIYAHRTHPFLMSMLSVRTHQFLTCLLSRPPSFIETLCVKIMKISHLGTFNI